MNNGVSMSLTGSDTIFVYTRKNGEISSLISACYGAILWRTSRVTLAIHEHFRAVSALLVYFRKQAFRRRASALISLLGDPGPDRAPARADRRVYSCIRFDYC